MKTFKIVFAAKNFALAAPEWAWAERKVDFLHDCDKAVLCTASFCAMELAAYLQKTDPGLKCVPAESFFPGEPAVILECLSSEQGDGGFAFELKNQETLVIRGNDRNGLVNGIYYFLRLQGWRWLEPGDAGEYAPEPHPVIFPEKSQEFKPSFRYRAFYFEYSSEASVDFLMWMARNNMNVFGPFPELYSKARKLGMYILRGGHIITSMLEPDKAAPSGQTLLEAHPDWYGVRADGAPVTAENALLTQFCGANTEVLDYIAEELISYLNTEWYGTDILEISGFDTWGNTCNCDICRNFSNSDKNIQIMSALRDRFDKAFAEGRLGHNPKLNIWAYEGTSSMEAPSDIPAAMTAAGDCCEAFVILRCYRHVLERSEECSINDYYARVLQDWSVFKDKLCLWAGEYYNVSRHEDLPLLFCKNIVASMKFYYETGVRGITYMHTPIINWSFRGLTQGLHAHLAWDIDFDAGAFAGEFFRLRYGKFAQQAAKAAELIEEASADVAEWRAWGNKSILSWLEYYGASGLTEGPLALRHYKDNEDDIANGRRITGLFRDAAGIMEDILDRVTEEYPAKPTGTVAVNPGEQRKLAVASRLLDQVSCDLMLLNYAVDMFQLMTWCMEAYDAIQKKDMTALQKVRGPLEELAKKMSLYTVSVSYRAFEPHFETRTALARSQCASFIRTLKGVEF